MRTIKRKRTREFLTLNLNRDDFYFPLFLKNMFTFIVLSCLDELISGTSTTCYVYLITPYRLERITVK